MSDRKGGIISKFFSSYDTLESAWEHGVIYGAVSSVFASAPMRKLRISMSRSLEGSLLVRFFSYVCGLLADVTLRTYGVFIFSSGLYSAVVYAIKYVSSSLTAELDALITGVLLMILSLPLLFSSKTLAHSAADSRIGSFVAFDMLGFWRDGITERESAHDRGDVAMLLGLLVGLSTFYFDAAVVLLSLLILLLVFVVFSRPEAGVIILFAFFPLMNEAFACGALLMIFASYVFKLARGRRTLKFDIVDTIFLIFSLQLLMGAAVNYGAGTSYVGNYTYAFFTLAYFLIKNLMTDDKWRMRMMRSAVFGGCILAAVALLHKLFDIESLPLDGIGSSVLASRIELFDSILSSAEALAPYMTAMMIIMAAYIAQRGGSTAFTALFIAAAAAAAVLMGSRGVWLGILFGVFALFIIAGKRFILAPTIAIAAIFAASLIFDESFLHSYMVSMFNISELYTVMRTTVRQNTLLLIADSFFGGVGVGDGIFAEIYDGYSAAGAYAADSGNLLLEITAELGVSGLMVFLAFLLLIFIKLFTSADRREGAKARVLAGAPAAGIIAVIFCGMTGYIWSDTMMFLGFCMILGLGASISEMRGSPSDALIVSDGRVIGREAKIHGHVYGSGQDASIDIKL